MKGEYLSKYAKKHVKKARKARVGRKVGVKGAIAGIGGNNKRVRNPPLKFKRGLAAKHKEIIRQESLGQQTENKLSFRVGRPDTRSRMMKAIGASSYYLKTNNYVLSSAGAGIQNCFTF